MGLSRNKVAVSEGAAGSPPFYGDQETESAGRSRDLVVELGKTLAEMCIRRVRIASVVQLSGFNRSLREQTHKRYGGVAQLGEHLPCKQGVMGSNPIISTIFQDRALRLRLEKSRR